MNKIHFSSATDKWATPQYILDMLPEYWDPCPIDWDPEVDASGLELDWVAESRGRLIFVNPPYGRGIGRWVDKMLLESKRNSILALVPARTSTRWFQRMMADVDVLFVKGRLKFGNSECGAPFPSAFVAYDCALPEMPGFKVTM